MREPPLDTDVAIETPEHIVFATRVAGPARRALAHVLDLALCIGVLILLSIIVLVVSGLASQGATDELRASAKSGAGIIYVLLFFTQWVYFALCEGKYGTTPGKKALGLRVVTTSGRPIGWREAALRNLLRTADFLPTGYLVGLVSMTASSRFQRLGDLVAGTMVVVPNAARFAHPLELWPPATPRELAELPDFVALDADARTAIELFLRRRHTLGPTREHELASLIAGPIGVRVGYAHPDPSRLLAIVYDRAKSGDRLEAPLSRRPGAYRPGGAVSREGPLSRGGARP